jgi:hypothetical protein
MLTVSEQGIFLISFSINPSDASTTFIVAELCFRALKVILTASLATLSVF